MRSLARNTNIETTMSEHAYAAGSVVPFIQMPDPSHDCYRNAREFAEMTRFSTCTNPFFDILADRPTITTNQLQVKLSIVWHSTKLVLRYHATSAGVAH
jgi:hypothetical protein